MHLRDACPRADRLAVLAYARGQGLEPIIGKATLLQKGTAASIIDLVFGGDRVPQGTACTAKLARAVCRRLSSDRRALAQLFPYPFFA